MIACVIAPTAFAAPLMVTGAELAIRWPQLIGETVQVQVTLVAALDAARYHVKIDKTDTVLLMSPDRPWTGRKRVCAAVMGPERGYKQGRSRVVGSC